MYNLNSVSVYKVNGLHVAEDGTIGRGVGFQRIRRVTGYLTGDLSRFNNGKKAEEHDRVKHLHV